jgi:hypothetical protein
MLRLILERVEIYHRSKKSENDAIPSNLQIEHVLPVSWATHWPVGETSITSYQANYPWSLDADQPDLAEAIRARISSVNRLGNLTLLNEYLNPAASNGSFELKKAEYRHSVLRLNRYFDDRANWDEAAIRERGRGLAQIITEIWSRPSSQEGEANIVEVISDTQPQDR